MRKCSARQEGKVSILFIPGCKLGLQHLAGNTVQTNRVLHSFDKAKEYGQKRYSSRSSVSSRPPLPDRRSRWHFEFPAEMYIHYMYIMCMYIYIYIYIYIGTVDREHRVGSIAEYCDKPNNQLGVHAGCF